MQSINTSNAASVASISATGKAADDLISALDRLGQHLAAGTIAANAPAATDREPTSDEQAAPGLLETLEAHRLGCERFTREATDETANEIAAQTYSPHFEALKGWTQPAANCDEAIAALQYASDECGCDIAKPMVDAVLAYLKLAGTSLDCCVSQAATQQESGKERIAVATQQEVWDVGDAASEVDSALSLMLHSLEAISAELVGNPLIQEVGHIENVIRLVQRRSSYVAEMVHEFHWRITNFGSQAG